MNLKWLFANEPNTESYAAGETVFDEGDEGESMYVVLEGEVDVVYKGEVIETVEPGGILGEMALVDKTTRSASAVAKSDAKLASIDRRRFTFLVQQHPFFALHIMEVMADRLRRQTG